MKTPTVIEFTGLENLQKNGRTYEKILINESILVFRHAFLTFEEQKQVQAFVGTALQCFPNQNEMAETDYIETHEIIQQTIQANKDEVLLDWHIEHAVFDNSIVLGFWNMSTFKVGKGNGNTVFVDLTNLYNNLSREDQDFLKSAITTFPSEMVKTNLNWEQDYIVKTGELTGDFVREHGGTKEPIIRISFGTHQGLSALKDRAITPEDKNHFQTLIDYFGKEVKNNRANGIVQEGEEGDLLIVDLQKMAHAVLGGFHSKDRKLQGMFSHQFNTNKYPEIDWDKRKK